MNDKNINFEIKNPRIAKIIIVTIHFVIMLGLLYISSFSTDLSCSNGKCTITHKSLFNYKNTKLVTLSNNSDFYCVEYRNDLDVGEPEDDRDYDYILNVQGQKIFKYAYKESCQRELNNINTSLTQNKHYENEYKHFFINILYKFLAIIFGLLTIISSISEVSPMKGSIKKPKIYINK